MNEDELGMVVLSKKQPYDDLGATYEVLCLAVFFPRSDSVRPHDAQSATTSCCSFASMV